MTTITATPAKLRNGTWGARVTDPVKVGQTITVKTKAGKTWQAKVTKIVWGGSDAALVATESLDRPAAKRPARRATPTGCACGSVYEYTKRTDCFACAHDNM